MYNYLSVDYLIVYAFLAMMLFTGIRAGRGIQDIKAYAITNKMFGTAALVLTWLATDIAGGTILDMTASIRTEGIIQILAVMGGWGIALLLQGLIFAPRFLRFSNCMTLGEVMGQLYQGPSQLITGILTALTALSIAGMELTVLGILCETLLGINYYWGVAVGGLILVVYTAYGGINFVTYTDVLQFLVLIIVIPILTIVALQQAGGIKQIFIQIPPTQFQLFNHPKITHYLAIFISLSVFQFSVINPALIPRILLGKTKQQLRNQFFIVAAVLFMLMLALLLLGLSSLLLFPTDTAVPIVPHLMIHILPVGIKGLAFAGIFAITMTTFDSFLHAAGLTLVHDVIRPLYNRQDKILNELKWARYITVLIGLVAIAVGLTRTTDLYGFVSISYQFTGPLLAFPLFLGVLGLKPDRQAFYIASVGTLGILILAKLLLPSVQQHIATLIGVLSNGILFLTTHAIRNQGFVINNNLPLQAYVWKPRLKEKISQIRNYLPTPKNILRYSQYQVNKYGASYILMGVFGLISYVTPYFMWEYDTTHGYHIMLYLRTIAAIACGLLVTKDKWPPSILVYLPTFWHLTLLYCLPFINTVMFLMTQGSIAWLINITLSMMLLIVLVDWLTFFILTVLGMALGLVFYVLLIGPISIHLHFHMGYLLVYQAIFATLIGLIFARKRQKYFDKLAHAHQILTVDHQESKEAYLETFKEKVRLLHTLKKAGIKDLPRAVRLIKELRIQVKETFQDIALVSTNTNPLKTLLQQLEDTMLPMAVTLERIENRATDYLRLDIQRITIDNLLAPLAAQLPKQPLQLQFQTKHQELICDPERIQKILLHSIRALQLPKNKKQLIYISLLDTQLTYPIYSLGKDYIKSIPAMGLVVSTHPIKQPLNKSYAAQMNGTNLPLPESTQELLLVANQRIIKAHYGYTNVDASKKMKYDHYLYIIPVRLTEIRPRDMNDPYMELGAELIRADDTYPGAAEQEKAFLTAVQTQTTANIKTIKTALEMIKWYHGAKNRHSGEPFYLHPLAVAHIVLDYSADEATIIGALLHDIVEDTAMLLESVEMIFGPDVVKIVDGVTHFESTAESFYKIRLSSHENLLMLLELKEKRALYVKIADRIHNLRTINGHACSDKKRKIAKETVRFYVPLAKALGLEQAAHELKEKSKDILYQLAHES